MTIIDQYIADNETVMTNREMASRLGVSYEFVRHRRNKRYYIPAIKPISPQDEIYALVQFILKRKSGMLVEIAERRIIDINKTLNY